MARRTPTQARAARTRAALVDSARQEFAQSGYAGTTARSIAERAGAATGSFYQYFEDKDEVLREICSLRLTGILDEARRIFDLGDPVGIHTGEAAGGEAAGGEAAEAAVQVAAGADREPSSLRPQGGVRDSAGRGSGGLEGDESNAPDVDGISLARESSVEGANVVDRGRLAAIVQLVIELHAQETGLHYVITEREHADPELRALTHRVVDALVQNIAEALRRWGYQGDRPARAYMMYALVEGAVHAHVLGEPVVSDRRFKRDLVNCLELLARHDMADSPD